MKINTLFCCCLLLFACKHKQPAQAGEDTLVLDNIDLQLNVKQFFANPDLFKATNEIAYRADTVREDSFEDDGKIIGIQYRQVVYSSRNTPAAFNGFDCYGLSMAATLDNQLMVIAAVIARITEKESAELIASLSKKYGACQKRTDAFMELKYTVYTWELPDRLIQFSPIYDDEKNALSLKEDEAGNITAGDKNAHYKGHIYITNKQYKDQTAGQMTTGDFVFYD